MSGLTKAELAACQNEGRVAWRDMSPTTRWFMMKHIAWLEVWTITTQKWEPSYVCVGVEPVGDAAYRLSPDAPTVDDAPTQAVTAEPKTTFGVMPREQWLSRRACDLARAVAERLELGVDADVVRWADELAAVVREVRGER